MAVRIGSGKIISEAEAIRTGVSGVIVCDCFLNVCERCGRDASE